MKEIKVHNFVWVDLYKPRYTEVENIGKRFNLHPLTIEEFSSPTLHPKAVEYDGSLYLAIHIPIFDKELKTTFPGEVDIVLTQDAMITSHDREIHQLTNLMGAIRDKRLKKDIMFENSPSALVHYLIELLLESCFIKIDYISKKLDYIEQEIFAGHEKEMVLEISKIKRDILNFRRTMKPQRSVIESLYQKDYKLIDPRLKPYFQDLIGTNIRIWNSLESSKETIESLESTNNSLLSNKLDMTMKVLTIFSAIFLPITVYSNILAMSADIPFGKSPYAFLIHISIMLIIVSVTIIVFRRKKWL
jgi:magnesium transporter